MNHYCLVVVLNLSGARNQFHGKNGVRGMVSGWLYYIYCAPYFYYCYIISKSDHQALEPGGLEHFVYSITAYMIPKLLQETVA